MKLGFAFGECQVLVGVKVFGCILLDVVVWGRVCGFIKIEKDRPRNRTVFYVCDVKKNYSSSRTFNCCTYTACSIARRFITEGLSNC